MSEKGHNFLTQSSSIKQLSHHQIKNARPTGLGGQDYEGRRHEIMRSIPFWKLSYPIPMRFWVDDVRFSQDGIMYGRYGYVSFLNGIWNNILPHSNICAAITRCYKSISDPEALENESDLIHHYSTKISTYHLRLCRWYLSMGGTMKTPQSNS